MPPSRPSPTERLSRALAAFRWAFMPLGLFALLAVGVHAAADTLDDRVRWVADHADALFDGLVAQWQLTQSWVHWVDLQQTTWLARATALVWEIAADLTLAAVAFGYRETAPAPRRRTPTLRGPPPDWRELGQRMLRRPTLLRWTRPLIVAPLALAGGCAIARMVQGEVYVSLFGSRGGHGGDAALFARLVAVAALGLVLATLGWRALLRSLQHADAVSEAECHRPTQALRVGLAGTVLLGPLALAALLDASPVLSFFR